MKVRICHSFIIRTLVNLQLSVISTSKLVLVASNKQSIFSGTAEKFEIGGGGGTISYSIMGEGAQNTFS